MKIYQLHLNGKNRAYHDFKTETEAQEYRKRLISYTNDRINEGQLGYRKYLSEAKHLQVVEIEKQVQTNTFSVCEVDYKGSSIIKNFSNLESAKKFLLQIREDSNRYYGIVESFVNA